MTKGRLKIESWSTLQVWSRKRNCCFITGLLQWHFAGWLSTHLRHCRGINLWRTATCVRLAHPVPVVWSSWWTRREELIRDNAWGTRVSRSQAVCVYVCGAVAEAQRSTYSTAAGNPSYLLSTHLYCDPEGQNISPEKRSRWHCPPGHTIVPFIGKVILSRSWTHAKTAFI